MATLLAPTGYDKFYAGGGWRYSRVREWWWHRKHLVRRFDLPRGLRMLEVACGSGFHTNLFCRMGFDCVGTDISATGIEVARQNYPGRNFVQGDATADLSFDEASFDIIITRGCSIYHYDLSGATALNMTRNLMRYIKPGGRFILIIATDLSGNKPVDNIWQNTLADYRAHFSKFDPQCTIDWYRRLAISSAIKAN
ncbi:MAG: class I SAM-dependent methyltransferase [Planctomycetes bacterium]|nr:class I SAM-dependent methyltransferase [Planctomycetota bacterium]